MTSTPSALVTGGSRGFGRALARALAARGWSVVVDGRDPDALADAVAGTTIVPVAGDVTDPAHRAELLAAAAPRGRLDLLVANASTLGPTPLPALTGLPPDEFGAILRVNLIAPLALAQLGLPALRTAAGTLCTLSSDAAVEAYAGWGGYGASKAALDQLAAVLAVEEPALRMYAVDPGDMRTAMHQAAFPGEDISDRPLPEQVVPSVLRLLDVRPASGRYRAADWTVPVTAAADPTAAGAAR